MRRAYLAVSRYQLRGLIVLPAPVTVGSGSLGYSVSSFSSEVSQSALVLGAVAWFTGGACMLGLRSTCDGDSDSVVGNWPTMVPVGS